MFKKFSKNDITSETMLLYENLIIYSNSFDDNHTRKYNNENYYHASNSLGYFGYYQTIYDNIPSIVDSHALCDVAYGISTASNLYASTTVQQTEKNNVYKIFASMLLGSPNERFQWGPHYADELFFITFKRDTYKNKICYQKSALWISSSYDNVTTTASDFCSTNLYKSECVGNYGALYSCSVGYVFAICYYDVGVMILPTASLMVGSGPAGVFSGSYTLLDILTGSSIDSAVDGMRNHLLYVNINPVTERRITTYKCSLPDREYNYSSNPTYVNNDGLIKVVSGSEYGPCVYVTGIAILDDEDNILMTAKTKPMYKDLNTSLVISVKSEH
ncbi:MAG: hypothetical protein WC438_05620 [Candidatus Pacearchaeota archaeon]